MMGKYFISICLSTVILLEINRYQYQTLANLSSENEWKENSEQKSTSVHNTHIHQHFMRQSAHRKYHKVEYAKTPLTIKNTPRLWQHLQETETIKNIELNVESGEESSHNTLSLDQLHSPWTDNLSIKVTNHDDAFSSDESTHREQFSNESLQSVEENKKKLNKRRKKKRMRCPKCEKKQQGALLTEEELTQLRIEFVKQQILEKLRLKKPPNIPAMRLPKPIYEPLEPENEHNKSKELDDYYARTSKKFIFLQKEKNKCQRLNGALSTICFSFKIDDTDIDSYDVNTAVLWVFKNKLRRHLQPNDILLNQETIVISELQEDADTKYLPISKTIAIQSVNTREQWLKIDIEWPIRRWIGNHELNHFIQISCQYCEINALEDLISVEKDYRPFIILSTQNRRRPSRQKRSINCTDGVTECCREKLYISFDEIGWGDWIVHPRGYDAYFCRGSCSSVASITQSSSHHNTFLQKMASIHRGNGNKPLELIPCCTAKKYSSLQLVFMDSNNTATQKTFPNMVVESCGCR